MDNDNKIANAETEKELLLFLGEELEPLRRTKRVNVYDLETEYAKTRKNKLWSVWITLGATLAVVVLVTVFTIRGLSASNEKIDVNLSSFEDLNLANLFDQLSRTQQNFDDATKRRAELQGSLEARLSRAKMKMESDLELLQNTRLSRAVRAARSEKIRSDYNSEVSAAHDELDATISAAETEVRQYEEQLKSYDSENVARAQQWEQQMDSERQVHELEKRKLIEDYDARLDSMRKQLEETRQKDFEERRAATAEISRHYEGEISKLDPVVRDQRMSGILQSADEKSAGVFDAEMLNASSGGRLSEDFAAALRAVQDDYNDLEYLYQKAADVPQRNTMKSVVPAEQKLSYNITNNLALSAVNEIMAKDSEIAEANKKAAAAEAAAKSAAEERDFERKSSAAYVNILNSGLFDSKTAGFVIDPASPRGVAVFIRDAFIQGITRDGSTKVEIYSGRSKVASGFIVYAGERYYVSLDDESAMEKISVGDTFRLGK